MKILIVSATPFEIAPLQNYLIENFQTEDQLKFQKDKLEVHLLITGVGLVLTGIHLTKKLLKEDYQLVINAGIAGTFDENVPIGTVVQVIEDRFADLGVEEANGSFTDVHEMGLIEANVPPFKNGVLSDPDGGGFGFLRSVKGISINKVHGHVLSIARIQKKYPEAQIETMEGAAFFYVCLTEKKPFLAVRAISNKVESRNRENWDIALAIESLNKVLLQMMEGFAESSEKRE